MRLRTIGTRLAGGIALTGGVLLVTTAPAWAVTYPPSSGLLLLSTTTVAAGGTVTVSGSEYASASTGTITLHTAPVTLGSFTADSSGDFTQTVTIPASTDPGTHTIEATGIAPGGVPLTEEALITVTAPGAAPAVPTAVTPTGAPPVSPPTATSGQLAFTGANISAMAGVGALLIVGGGALLAGRHRMDHARI